MSPLRLCVADLRHVFPPLSVVITWIQTQKLVISIGKFDTSHLIFPCKDTCAYLQICCKASYPRGICGSIDLHESRTPGDLKTPVLHACVRYQGVNIVWSD